ncbi:MAG: hypothetical protein ACKOA1_02910, partial [Bacteroidota bacterium]
ICRAASALQMQRGQYAHDAEVMVTMKVTDENMVDTVKSDTVLDELQQGTLRAINQKKPLMDPDDLSGWVSLVDGGG